MNVPSLVCAGVIAAMATVHAQPAARLTVCHAGSLLAAFVQLEHAFTAQHPDVAVKDVSDGSVSLVRRLASGSEACDVYASADYLNIDQMLKPAKLADYTVVFAKGRMVLAYLATDPKARCRQHRPRQRAGVGQGVQLSVQLRARRGDHGQEQSCVSVGPTPISPAIVIPGDYGLQKSTQALVTTNAARD